MQCPQCQAPLPETSLQCAQCGADVGWYFRKPDGAEYGPYDLATVDLCLREARLGPGDMVRIGAGGDYQSAQHLLGDRFSKLPPPTTYYPTVGPYRAPSPAGSGGGGMKTCGIVAGILGLVALASLAALIPVFQRARKMTTQSSCQSNLKQLDTGLRMYCVDWDERFPTPGNWQVKLDPYVKNMQLWTCPAYPKELGYRGNDRLARVLLRDVARPAETLTLWDAGVILPGLGRLPNTTPNRHNGGDNFGYADGHVKWSATGNILGHRDPRAQSPMSPPGP